VRNEFVFLFNTSWKSQFSTWRKAPLVPISLFSYIGKTNVSLERKPSVSSSALASREH
jgi:hypothetical protein